MLIAVDAFGLTGLSAREVVPLAAVPSVVVASTFSQEYGVSESEPSTMILSTSVPAFAIYSMGEVVTRQR